MSALLGGLLIIIACAWLGQNAAARLRERRYRLLDAGSGLLALAREIDYFATPLPEALDKAAAEAGRAAALFHTAAEALRGGDGMSGREAWRAALAQTAQLWSAAEAAALDTAAAGLGATDAETQKKHLELTRLRLAECERAAAEADARYGKLWRSMGWAGGAVLVLLLL